MITDAKWEDMNRDGIKDLITCGDWNNINFFIMMEKISKRLFVYR